MVNRLTPSVVAIANLLSLNSMSIISGDGVAMLNTPCFSPVSNTKCTVLKLFVLSEDVIISNRLGLMHEGPMNVLKDRP